MLASATNKANLTHLGHDSVAEQHQRYLFVITASDRLHLSFLVEHYFQGVALQLFYRLFLRLATTESNSSFK